MILLDTSYFIALLDPRDQLHGSAIAWSHALADEPLLVTSEVLVETANYFSAFQQRSSVHELIARLRKAPKCEFVHVTPELFGAGLHLHEQRMDKTWSLTDCISFTIMRQRNIQKALTFDRHFEQAGFVALLRLPAPNKKRIG